MLQGLYIVPTPKASSIDHLSFGSKKMSTKGSEDALSNPNLALPQLVEIFQPMSSYIERLSIVWFLLDLVFNLFLTMKKLNF